MVGYDSLLPPARRHRAKRYAFSTHQLFDVCLGVRLDLARVSCTFPFDHLRSSEDDVPIHSPPRVGRLGRTINRFRKKRLGLESVSLASGASAVDRLKVPYIYCWTSELIPKPRDWMQNIDITGFLFLESAGYQPKPDLAKFLADGPPPVYIGFGSIVVEDPTALTRGCPKRDHQ